MPTRPKRSDWKPTSDIFKALREVDHLYPNEVLAEIVRHVPFTSPKSQQRLGERVVNAAAFLHVDIHSERRPSGPQIRATLEHLERAAKGLQEALEGLDHDSRIELIAAAKEDGEQDLATPIQVGAAAGIARLRDVEGQIGDLRRWVVVASAQAPKGKPGRKKEDALHHAVESLLAAWVEAGTDQSATLSAFEPFVTAALAPVCGDRSFEAVCQNVLYQ